MYQLTPDDTLDDLVAQHEYSLLFFSASWCSPCQSMTPIVATISSLMNEQLQTIKIDIDKSPNDPVDYGIRSVPTLILVNNNEIIAQQVGGVPAQQLVQWLEQHI